MPLHLCQAMVSKKTESGSRLAGAFVVRGQRHGTETYPRARNRDGSGKWSPLPVIGTVEAISNYFGRWVRVIPGRDKKENIANSISKATGLSQDDVLSVLPPGNCSIEDYGLLRRAREIFSCPNQAL